MDMMQIRRAVMSASGQPNIPSIGGLPIYADNCYMTGSGKLDDIIENNDLFITGIFDTGDNLAKEYEVTRWGTDVPGTIRFFNDLTSNSVDYWTIMRTDIAPGVPNIYRFGSVGRYIAISVAKYCASDFYLKYSNGDYIVKGNNIT